MTSRSLLTAAAIGLFAVAGAPARAQDDEPQQAAEATEEAPPPPPKKAAPPKGQVAAPVAPAAASTTTIHDRGGLFGVGLVVAPKIGGGLGSVFFKGLGATFSPSLELGYNLPLPAPINRDLELFVEGAYAAPTADEIITNDDPRLPGGSFHYTLTLHQWSLATGALYRIPVPIAWLRPTVSVALNTVFSRTVVTGDSGDADFATATEDATDFGVVGAVGADLFVGPGAISVEVKSAWVPADRFVLRETSATAVGLFVGYRFFL